MHFEMQKAKRDLEDRMAAKIFKKNIKLGSFDNIS